MIASILKPHIPAAKILFDEGVALFQPGLILSVAAGCVEHRKYWSAYVREFIGTILMVGFTFSAGKWIGQDDVMVAWSVHSVGVILADYFGGGQHVNPAVTVSMWALGKCTYTEAFVRIAGQMGGGLVAFPLFQYASEQFNLTPFGGPEFSQENDVDAFLSEFFASFLLMWVIYILNWEFNFGSYHYIIKQFLTAVAIRALIEAFPTAGPAMNPMLATAWYVFGVGNKYEYPNDAVHYFVYWFGPFLAGILAAITYIIFDGSDKLFGIIKLPITIRSKKETKAKKD
ncbi:aquaporin-like protein [Fragilariopsis cylindrus CCMP1102]|uniref:Aquaporin-like protein n=1 Tax=Fragilariopsis cylindrus CCMP1102 TaxID=635003 RepID=A0A1E7FY28_9STRA|nr:aquaporin-like protein [Fragilariopsis cylindrus CCMP1102]|eukprot:OEU23058.1 aquaporin-like protein [Fragilariopsis cylindrus CCMP1102]